MIIDTHCHLDELSSKDLTLQLDVDSLYLMVGVSSSNWEHVIHLSSSYPNTFPALGLHPWFVTANYLEEIELLSTLLQNNKVFAFGEIGLDFSTPYHFSKNYQLKALEVQLKMAQQHNLPVSLHVYKAHNEVINLLKEFTVVGVIHGFNSSVEIAKQYLDLGFKLGVNGIIARENARRYHSFVKALGLNALVLETDAPNIILPNHTKGSLLDIQVIIHRIADLVELPESEVIKVTGANARAIFNFKDKS